MDVVSLYSTWPDLRSAEAAAEALVESRLIACANILPGARSVYRWEGELRHDDEVVMFAKTTSAMAEAARTAMVDAHPYDTPCVLRLDIEVSGSNPAFLAWVGDETGG